MNIKSEILEAVKIKDFNCYIIRMDYIGDRPQYMPRRSWINGYVEIPKNHSLYKIMYYDDKFPNLKVHGGVTFSGKLKIDDESLELTTETDNWFIGFDTNHFTDNILIHDENYVLNQIKQLVEQI